MKLLIQFKDETTLMQVSETGTDHVNIELIDIVGDSTNIVLNKEEGLKLAEALTKMFNNGNQ